MHNVIVGTAGHVDHGKTCLIKALSGIDTDRLKEEKKRGITIELGFANLPNEEGIQIGIIDVPGHEKFVKNMLAGIGGIDLVLLVIALEEGVMPQTREHFEILKMLQIKQGIVVFTKADLVDDDWAELVNDDVDSLLKDSFMEHSPRIRVSSHTGQNIEELRNMIIQRVKTAAQRRQDKELFRLPIDRVFTMDGFGTVITGTLLEGCCQVGQEIELYPQEKIVKIRGLQVHGQKVDMAFAGHRTAMNLVNIKKEEINRGEVLAAPGSLIKSQFIDAKVQLFSNTDRQLKNGDRVHLNFGSAQTICKVILFGKDTVQSGGEAYVQLRFDEPVAMKRNDRFIIRFYSPIETFGGGIVLDAEAMKHKRNQEDVLLALQLKDKGTDLEILEQMLIEESQYFPSIGTMATKMNWREGETEKGLADLVKSKKAICIGENSYIHKQYWNSITEYGIGLLDKFHKENPITDGMEKEEFKSRILERFRVSDAKKGDILLNEMIKRKVTAVNANAIAVAGFTTKYSNQMETVRAKILKRYEDAGFEMPNMEDVIGEFQDKKQAKQIITDLVKTGILVKVTFNTYIHKIHWQKALSILQDYGTRQKELSLGEYRDMLGTSRKYAVMLLEYCDAQKITKKQGDIRILLKTGQ